MKNIKSAVSWYLPEKKKPIAYSTKAVSDFIELMAKEYQTINDIYGAINYDKDAQEIMKKYIDSGYGQAIALDLFR